MSDLLWRKLKEVKVPEAPGAVWSTALDYVAPKRLCRLTAPPGGEWKLKGQDQGCSPDGYSRAIARGVEPNSKPIVADAPLGCLIAKIGGSTADNSGLIFAAGRYCVFQIEEAKAGPLYLGANDVPLYMGEVEEQLTVQVEVAL